MKKEDIDLKALENADNDTINRLADKGAALSAEEKAKLFRRTERLYAERTSGAAAPRDDGETVSGVDVYRRPAWRRYVAAAAVALVVAGAGVGGAAMLSRSNSKAPLASEVSTSETTEETTDASASETSSEAVTEEPASEEPAVPAENVPSNAPFGNISEDDVRCVRTEYTPDLYCPSREAIRELAAAFNSAEWLQKEGAEDIVDDIGWCRIYVYNDGFPFTVDVYSNGAAIYVPDNDNCYYYKISQEAAAAAISVSTIKDDKDYEKNTVYKDLDGLDRVRAWDDKYEIVTAFNVLTTPEPPEEIVGKRVEYIYAAYADYDYNDINEIAKRTGEIIFGKVEDVFYYSEDGAAYTGVKVSVTDSATGLAVPGQTVTIRIKSGYIRASELIETAAWAENPDIVNVLGKNDDLENVYCYMTGSLGLVPCKGVEYAFCVEGNQTENGYFTAVGFEYGMLRKSGDKYYRRADKDSSTILETYSLEEVRKFVSGDRKAENVPYSETGEPKDGTGANVPFENQGLHDIDE